MNKHKVTKRQWSKWNDKQRELFNSIMDAKEEIMGYPAQNRIAYRDWGEMVIWNAAFTAACNLKQIENNEITI